MLPPELLLLSGEKNTPILTTTLASRPVHETLTRSRIVGLVPAAGEAKRMHRLPCSKEILPLGMRQISTGEYRVKVACHVLLEAMKCAGANEIHMILRAGKEDVPRFLGLGDDLGIPIHYAFTAITQGPPFTVDRVYHRIRSDRVLFGFPDILFEPLEALARLLDRQDSTEAELVLGLFPTDRVDRMDMVRTDLKGRVLGLEIKPARTELLHTWVLAAWTPQFTDFLHDFVCRVSAGGRAPKPEYHFGDVIAAALSADLRVESVLFEAGRCVDIGSPKDYAAAMLHGGNLSAILSEV